MTEAKIKKKVVKELEKEGYIIWYPPVSKFAPKFKYGIAKDIFSLFDCMALKDSDLRFIQYTSQNNMQARKRKIMKFYDQFDVFLPCEVWGVEEDSIKVIHI